MTTRLEDLPVRKVLRALDMFRFEHIGTDGGHAIFRGRDGQTVIVPIHDVVKRGTLATIIRQAGMTPQEFFDSPGLWHMERTRNLAGRD